MNKIEILGWTDTDIRVRVVEDKYMSSSTIQDLKILGRKFGAKINSFDNFIFFFCPSNEAREELLSAIRRWH